MGTRGSLSVKSVWWDFGVLRTGGISEFSTRVRAGGISEFWDFAIFASAMLENHA